jgi:hypothetical protein
MIQESMVGSEGSRRGCAAHRARLPRGARDDRCAGPAGQRLAAAALEGPLPEPIAVEELDELDVDAAREPLMGLHRAAHLLDGRALDVFDEGHRVRVAGVAGHELQPPAGDRELDGRFDLDFAHGRTHVPVREQLDLARAGVGPNSERVTGSVPACGGEPRDAPQAVAAHRAPRAVGVPHGHPQAAVGVARQQDQSVRADAEASVGPRAGQGGRALRGERRADSVDEEVVVAAPLHLGEGDLGAPRGHGYVRTVTVREVIVSGSSSGCSSRSVRLYSVSIV